MEAMKFKLKMLADLVPEEGPFLIDGSFHMSNKLLLLQGYHRNHTGAS